MAVPVVHQSGGHREAAGPPAHQPAGRARAHHGRDGHDGLHERRRGSEGGREAALVIGWGLSKLKQTRCWFGGVALHQTFTCYVSQRHGDMQKNIVICWHTKILSDFG